MIKRLSLSLLFTIFTHSLFAGELYNIEITSGKSTYQESFDSIVDLIDASQQSNLAINLTGYNQLSAALMDIRLGDKKATIVYEAGKSELTFTMGDCGIVKKFDEGSRARTEETFRKYLNKNRGNILNCLYDGGRIVGGPESSGGDWAGPDEDTTPEDGEQGGGLGLSVGRYSIGNQNHTVLTLPLSYTHYYKEQGRKLKLSAPLSYIDVNGSKVYKVAVGAAYTRPMNEKWTVIPAVRIGLTGSDDMAIGATTVSATVTNRYELPYHNKHITLSNMVGVMTSLNYSLGGFDSYYDVDNQIFKNGITVEYPLSYKVLGGKTSMELSLANTQLFGNKTHVDNYTDIAVSMGTRRKVDKKDNTQDSMQLGLTYTIGNKGYKGGKINFGYKF